jgi:hypothetical protein
VAISRVKPAAEKKKEDPAGTRGQQVLAGEASFSMKREQHSG